MRRLLAKAEVGMAARMKVIVNGGREMRQGWLEDWVGVRREGGSQDAQVWSWNPGCHLLRYS